MFTTNCTKPLDLLPVNGQNWPNLYFYSPILIAASISLFKMTPTKGSITETSIPTNPPSDPAARPSYLRLFAQLFGVGLPHRRDDLSYFTAQCTDIALHKTKLAKSLTSCFIYFDIMKVSKAKALNQLIDMARNYRGSLFSSQFV